MTLDLIPARRSISPKRLIEPGPNIDQIEIMIEAACAAPDHRCLRPWRFSSIHNDHRQKLANLLEAAAREAHGDLTDEQAERAREKALNGPCLIAAIGRIKDDLADVPAHEQWVSVGAAVQNIMLVATALGFGSMIVSGNKVRTTALTQGLGLGTGEHLLGFIAIGTMTKLPATADRPIASDVLSIWPDDLSGDE